MIVSLTNNLHVLQSRIDRLAPANKSATIKAMTATAWDVKYALKKEMQRVFDRPTPWTLNATYVKPATASNMGAAIGIKDFAGKGTAAAEYLKPQIYSGARSQKSFERVLRAYGLLPAQMQAIPTTAVKLDRYGNVPKGLLVQVLSQLKVQLTGGYNRAATNSKRSLASVAKQGVNYFVLPQGHGKLKPGIYARRTVGRTNSVYPVFIFLSNISYRRRFDFFGVAERTAAQKFESNYQFHIQKQIKGI